MSQAPGRELLNNGGNFVETMHTDTYPFIDPKKRNLKGRNVLVTGTSRGIGVEIAKSFASAGASGIAIAARSDLSAMVKEVLAAASEAGREAPTVLPLTVDVSDTKSVEAATSKLQRSFEHLDIVVNNAGVLEPFTRIADSDPDVWWKTFEINIKGTYLLLRSFVPMLLKSPNPEKTFLVMTSKGAHVMMDGASAYQSSKYTQMRLVEFANFEYGEQGLLCYGMHPGSVQTLMAETMGEKYKALFTDTPKLPADTVTFLTSERRDWLAGRYVAGPWDMEEFLAKKDEIVKGDLLKNRMAVESPQ